MCLFYKKYPVYGWDEIIKHNSHNDCWIVVKNNIYDITNYVNLHPGGILCIAKYAGKRADDVFKYNHHHGRYLRMISKYKIGKLSK